jgi:hypothetical protein
MRESNSHIATGSPEPGTEVFVSGFYLRYGQGVYTFCLRLLANKKAAESATVDVFVRFGKDLEIGPDESRAVLRLRELAIKASFARLNGRGRTIWRRLTQSLSVTLRRVVGLKLRRERR